MPATAAFLSVAALMLLSCRCLAAAVRATDQTTYGGVLAAQLGPGAAAALDVSMVLDCFGEGKLPVRSSSVAAMESQRPERP